MGEAIKLFFTQAVGVAIGCLVAAVIVQYATRWIAKFKPPYGMAYKAALVGSLVLLALGFVVDIIAPSGNEFIDGVFVALFAAGLLIQAFFYGTLIKDPGRVALGFGRGVLVTLTQLVVITAIAALIFALFYVLRAAS